MKFIALFFLLFASQAHAAQGNISIPLNPVAQVNFSYAGTNVTTASYVNVLVGVPQDVKFMDIFDCSGQTMLLAQTMDGGKTYKVLEQIFPGGSGFINLPATGSSTLAVKAVSGTANSCSLQINLYN